MLSDMDGFRARMCACREQSCVDAVKKSYGDWQWANPEKIKGAAPEDVAAKGAKILDGMDACARAVKAPTTLP
jgi:hypothetical protein